MKTSVIAARAFAVTLIASCGLVGAQTQYIEFQVEGVIEVARGQSELPGPFAFAQVGDTYRSRQRYLADEPPNFPLSRASAWSNIQVLSEYSINGGPWITFTSNPLTFFQSMMSAESTTERDQLVLAYWYTENHQTGKIFTELSAAPGSLFSPLPATTSELIGLTAEDFHTFKIFCNPSHQAGRDINAYFRGTVDSLEVVLINPSPGAAIVLVMAGTLSRARRRSSHA